jgi:hypothetical protein
VSLVVHPVPLLYYPSHIPVVLKGRDPVRSRIVINNNTTKQNKTVRSSQVQKHTRLRKCNTMALPTLLCKCETWAVREQDKSRIMSAELKFVRMAKYTW